MRSDAQLIIRLAVPSVLYAPLYLAKTLARTAETREQFAIFQHVEFDYAGKPFDSHTAVDELILPVLRARELSINRPAPILAVGDPTRIASALSIETLDQPYVVGGLITKMCYWLMDGRADSGFNKHEEFEEVVVHPQGMTGYSLFKYETQEHRTLDGAQAVACYPGDELRVYSARTFCERDYKRAAHRYFRARGKTLEPGRLPSAFLTTDPAIAMRAWHGRRWRVIRAYGRDSREEFQNVLMTGLITGQDLYGKARRQRQIDAIIAGIAEAIAIIKCDEFLAASCLLSYSDQRIDFGESYDVDQLALHLEELVDTKSFNSHPQLKVTDVHVRHAVQIRKAAGITDEVTSLHDFEQCMQAYVEVQTCGNQVKHAAGEVIRFFSRPPHEQRNGAVSSFLRRVFSEERSERVRLRRWRIFSVAAVVAVTIFGAVSAFSETKFFIKFFTSSLGVSVILLFASLLALYDYIVFIGEQRNRRGHSSVWTSLALSAALSTGVYHGVRTLDEVWPTMRPKWPSLDLPPFLHTLAETPWFTILTPFVCAFLVVLGRELKPVARERLWWSIKENARLLRLHLRLGVRRIGRTIRATAFQVFSIAVFATLRPIRIWAEPKGKPGHP